MFCGFARQFRPKYFAMESPVDLVKLVSDFIETFGIVSTVAAPPVLS